ncbi:MAG: hypothetical protein AAGD25_39715 [Cyanobacteria bacterium P01_F01_bin.150]
MSKSKELSISSKRLFLVDRSRIAKGTATGQRIVAITSTTHEAVSDLGVLSSFRKAESHMPLDAKAPQK